MRRRQCRTVTWRQSNVRRSRSSLQCRCVIVSSHNVFTGGRLLEGYDALRYVRRYVIQLIARTHITLLTAARGRRRRQSTLDSHRQISTSGRSVNTTRSGSAVHTSKRRRTHRRVYNIPLSIVLCLWERTYNVSREHLLLICRHLARHGECHRHATCRAPLKHDDHLAHRRRPALAAFYTMRRRLLILLQVI